MHKILFDNKFIKNLYMFRALCAHHQDLKIVYTASGIITFCRWPSGAQIESPLSTCAPDGHLQVRRYQMLYIQFRPPDDEHIVLENKLIIKQDFVHHVG